MTPMSQMPSRDSQPSQQEGLEGLSSQSSESQAPQQPSPDPKEVLRTKLMNFRSIDSSIQSLAQASQNGSKYASQISNILKAWMVEEVKSTPQPAENPRIPGAS